MNKDDMFIQLIVTAWQTQNNRVDKMLDTLTEEQLAAETAPGRNSGVYLLGHLAAVNDGLFPLLGFGQRLYPDLENVFLKNPDKSGLPKPSLNELKIYWKEINTKLEQHIKEMPADEWLTKHAAVSAEDFAKEPFRNKMNILINRTNHQSYHLGQMTYLK